MSDIEHLIEEALRPVGAGPPPPSRDLFGRVLESVADDRRRRRKARRVAAAWTLGCALWCCRRRASGMPPSAAAGTAGATCSRFGWISG